MLFRTIEVILSSRQNIYYKNIAPQTYGINKVQKLKKTSPFPVRIYIGRIFQKEKQILPLSNFVYTVCRRKKIFSIFFSFERQSEEYFSKYGKSGNVFGELFSPSGNNISDEP